jgi:hypothetical protein
VNSSSRVGAASTIEDPRSCRLGRAARELLEVLPHASGGREPFQMLEYEMNRFSIVGACGLFLLGCGVGGTTTSEEGDFAETQQAASRQGKNGVCHQDRALDNPGSVALTVVGPSRLGAKLTRGTDASGTVRYVYRFRDPAGAIQEISPEFSGCFGPQFVNDAIVAHLKPATTYTFTLVSSDACGHTTQQDQTFQTPALAAESVAPTIVGAPGLLWCSIFGARYVCGIRVSANDDSGIDRAEFTVDGAAVTGTCNYNSSDMARSQGLTLFAASSGELLCVTKAPGAGVHQLDVKVFDAVGNSSAASASVTVDP